jgi:hypothetical protein
LAEQDLQGALERALMLPPTGQAETAAEQRIAVVMARIDPLAALELQYMITNPTQRTRYRDRLVDEWAKTDPAAVLAYLETSSDLTEVMVGEAGFRAMATSAPEQLLALSDRFAPQQRAWAQAAALKVLAALDPAAAFARINSLPPSGSRDSFVAVVAEGYAAQDPEGALAWASTLQPRPTVVVNAVLSGIGATDPVRAAELVIAEILNPVAANRVEMPSLISALSAALQSGSPAIGQIADRLSAHTDPRVKAQLDSLLLSWSAGDAETAVNWALRNTDHLRTASATSFGYQVAAQDPALARQSLQRLPRHLQGAWVQGVAGGWADQDRAGAEGWVLGLPRDASRDGGLGVLLQRAASNGTVNSRVLDAFSSDEARIQALSSAMPALGALNPELGRRLIAEFIRDPQRRDVAERQLELGAQRGSFPGSVIPLR